MREANIKKIFIKVFSLDGSAKSLLVDESMTCGYVTRLLAEKNHTSLEPSWGLVEYVNDLHMGKFDLSLSNSDRKNDLLSIKSTKFSIIFMEV